jgi:hypothetical protein
MATTRRKDPVAPPKVPTAVREAYLVWLRATAKMRKTEVQALRREIKATLRQEKEQPATKTPADPKVTP